MLLSLDRENLDSLQADTASENENDKAQLCGETVFEINDNGHEKGKSCIPLARSSLEERGDYPLDTSLPDHVAYLNISTNWAAIEMQRMSVSRQNEREQSWK